MRIKCAAIRYQGNIFEGESHYSIFQRMRETGVCEKMPGGDDQGFVTECGRYVRRAPALMIAIRAGQVIQGETENKLLLFSEDLRKEELDQLKAEQDKK